MDVLPGQAFTPDIVGDSHLRLPYVALPYQDALIDDIHRFLIVVASRRVGKTVTAINKLLEWAMTRDVPDDTAFWYIAPYYHQAKTIAWNLLLRYVPRYLWARKPNESSLTLYLTNGRTIVLKGGDNSKSLEGTALGGLVVDEISLMTHWTQLWDYSLRPMLSDYRSPAMFISKPRGFNHFHDLAKMGDHNNIIEGEATPGIKLNNDYMTYRFETEINCREHNGGYIDHEEIEAARQSMPPEAFDQEYLGRFTKYTGLVHKEFDRAIHLLSDPDMVLPLDWPRYRSYDFGSNDPMASAKIAIDPDGNWYIEDCIKERDIGLQAFADKVLEQDKDFLNNDGVDTIPGYGDPTGRMWIKELNNKKLSIRKATKTGNTSETSWVQLGIDKINDKLRTKEGHTVFLPTQPGEEDMDQIKIEDAPSFFVLNKPGTLKLVAEFETLAYRQTQTGINRSEIDDTTDKVGHFDLEASLRYYSVSYDKKLSYETLDNVEPSIATQSAAIQHQKEKPIYVPPAINMNDAEARKALERQADIDIVRQQQQQYR